MFKTTYVSKKTRLLLEKNENILEIIDFFVV